ncbi:hypothetical protein [Azospirillum largimobile]
MGMVVKHRPEPARWVKSGRTPSIILCPAGGCLLYSYEH